MKKLDCTKENRDVLQVCTPKMIISEIRIYQINANMFMWNCVFSFYYEYGVY